jgi:hypothetical protein
LHETFRSAARASRFDQVIGTSLRVLRAGEIVAEICTTVHLLW